MRLLPADALPTFPPYCSIPSSCGASSAPKSLSIPILDLCIAEDEGYLGMAEETSGDSDKDENKHPVMPRLSDLWNRKATENLWCVTISKVSKWKDSSAYCTWILPVHSEKQYSYLPCQSFNLLFRNYYFRDINTFDVVKDGPTHAFHCNTFSFDPAPNFSSYLFSAVFYQRINPRPAKRSHRADNCFLMI